MVADPVVLEHPHRPAVDLEHPHPGRVIAVEGGTVVRLGGRHVAGLVLPPARDVRLALPPHHVPVVGRCHRPERGRDRRDPCHLLEALVGGGGPHLGGPHGGGGGGPPPNAG